jgi:hypothetical protein
VEAATAEAAVSAMCTVRPGELAGVDRVVERRVVDSGEAVRVGNEAEVGVGGGAADSGAVPMTTTWPQARQNRAKRRNKKLATTKRRMIAMNFDCPRQMAFLSCQLHPG